MLKKPSFPGMNVHYNIVSSKIPSGKTCLWVKWRVVIPSDYTRRQTIYTPANELGICFVAPHRGLHTLSFDPLVQNSPNKEKTPTTSRLSWTGDTLVIHLCWTEFVRTSEGEHLRTKVSVPPSMERR